MNRDFSKNLKSNSGQAIIEYTLLIIVVMTLCLSVYEILKDRLSVDGACPTDGRSLNPKCIIDSAMGRSGGTGFQRYRL